MEKLGGISFVLARLDVPPPLCAERGAENRINARIRPEALKKLDSDNRGITHHHRSAGSIRLGMIQGNRRGNWNWSTGKGGVAPLPSPSTYKRANSREVVPECGNLPVKATFREADFTGLESYLESRTWLGAGFGFRLVPSTSACSTL
jgi:hypothetical protein